MLPISGNKRESTLNTPDQPKSVQSSTQRLIGKVIIITGASQGIGASTARYLAQQGAIVVLAARNAEKLAAVASQITEANGQAFAVTSDVSDPASMQRLVEQTLEKYGRLDAAFNNAAGGGHRPTPLADVRVEDFDSAYQINLRGIFLAMKYQIPAMLSSGGGVIVNMSSTAGTVGVPGMTAYTSTKHGVIGLSKTAALDYAQQNIRVNVVAPGPILTDRLSSIPEAMRENVARGVPMRRIGQPDEVAATVAWLCSDDASFITGAVITIDGGRLAGIG
jgi:NAD(P)-dependent dehydrogenase (short-subunit alcohol dehydrogenase family)